MSLAKQAQNLDGFTISVKPGEEADMLPSGGSDAEQLPIITPQPEMPIDFGQPEAAPMDSGLAMDDHLFLVDEEPEEELVFVLPPLPGSDDQSDFRGPEPEIEVEDDEIIIDDDPWKWTCGSFMQWLSGMMGNIPGHSGYDSTGLERAIAYLETLDREISKAVRMDLKNEIAVDAVEKAREEIHKGLERLHDRHDKVMESRYPKRKKSKKKKADGTYEEFVKEAKSAHISGITVTVSGIVSVVARTCINSMVSAGKDIEDTFDKLSKKFNFNDREEAETMQLLSDMGYPMRRPRGFLRDEEIDYTSTDNFDYQPNYPA